jgi:hypothetical protein
VPFHVSEHRDAPSRNCLVNLCPSNEHHHAGVPCSVQQGAAVRGQQVEIITLDDRTPAWSSGSRLDAEAGQIGVLCHQLAVLERLIAHPQCTPSDRLVLATMVGAGGSAGGRFCQTAMPAEGRMTPPGSAGDATRLYRGSAAGPNVGGVRSSSTSRRRAGSASGQVDPETEIRWLLRELCSELGFCIILEQADVILDSVPPDADAFTDRVFMAEGLDPMVDRALCEQVRSKIDRRIGQLLAARRGGKGVV